MKNISLFCTLILAIATAGAQNCKSIKNDKQRLACFDKSAAVAPSEAIPPPNAAAALPHPPAAPSLPPGIVSHTGNWFVRQDTDAMTDKKKCVALYKNEWTIQGSVHNLYISLRGRGGVKAYTLRFDDAPAEQMQLPSNMEKEMNVVILEPSFDRIYNGSRLRAEIVTVLGSVLVEDIDLKGFKEAVDYMAGQGC
jgi:hypothetical protein